MAEGWKRTLQSAQVIALQITTRRTSVVCTAAQYLLGCGRDIKRRDGGTAAAFFIRHALPKESSHKRVQDLGANRSVVPKG